MESTVENPSQNHNNISNIRNKGKGILIPNNMGAGYKARRNVESDLASKGPGGIILGARSEQATSSSKTKGGSAPRPIVSNSIVNLDPTILAGGSEWINGSNLDDRDEDAFEWEVGFSEAMVNQVVGIGGGSPSSSGVDARCSTVGDQRLNEVTIYQTHVVHNPQLQHQISQSTLVLESVDVIDSKSTSGLDLSHHSVVLFKSFHDVAPAA